MTAAQRASTVRGAYVSLLSTADYLPGALVLHASLMRTAPAHPFLLLLTPSIPAAVKAQLSRHGIDCQLITDPVIRPGKASEPRWSGTFSKLLVFGLTGFERVVFLDADMLVLRNLDELFARPHMSAVNAGGMLPEHRNWTQLNSGLLVIEPSAALAADLLRFGRRANEEDAAGDQTILQAYFSDWDRRDELHLDHRFNVFHTHLDRYHEQFGYTFDDIRVIHFIGETKPWTHDASNGRRRRMGLRGAASALGARLRGRPGAAAPAPLRDEAIRLWRQCYDELGRTGALR